MHAAVPHSNSSRLQEADTVTDCAPRDVEAHSVRGGRPAGIAHPFARRAVSPRPSLRRAWCRHRTLWSFEFAAALPSSSQHIARPAHIAATAQRSRIMRSRSASCARRAMSGTVVLLCLLLALPSAVLCALFPANSGVIQANGKTFDAEVLAIEKPTFVAFTAPWCGHCQNLVPQYSKAAKSLGGIVKFVNVDCDVDSNKQTCARYGVQGFPTIKFFPATKKRLPRDYRGERTAKELAKFGAESLPQTAKKLTAEGLIDFVEADPDRPSVILFTTKSVSSPLLRSLALDFRVRVPFAFARGDEALVRSHARLDLGLDIPTADNLPVLVIFPARKDGRDFDKGKFETYEGKLAYAPLKKWLDEMAPKLGAMDEKEARRVAKLKEKENAADKTKSAKSKKARKAEEERQRRAAVKKQIAKEQQQRERASAAAAAGAKVSDEELPEGAAYEWKAVRSDPKGKKLPVPVNVRDEEGNIVDTVETDEDAQRLLGRAGEGDGMLDKDRARQMILDMQRQSEEIEKRKAAQKVSADEWKDQEAPPLSEQSESIFDSAAKLVKQAAEAGTEAAADILDAGADFVEAAASSGSKVVESLAEKLGSAGKLEGDETSGPFARKRKALLKSFERWMTSEHNDWAETYGDEFAKAQKEAEALARQDPEEAERLAWQNEAWLLEELSADRDKMKAVMTHDQLAEVDKMIDLVTSRLEKRRAIAGTQDPPPSKKKTKVSTQGQLGEDDEIESERSKHHDEL